MSEDSNKVIEAKQKSLRVSLPLRTPTSSEDSYFPEKLPFPKSMRCNLTHELASALRVSKTLDDQNLQLHCRTHLRSSHN